MTEKKQQHKKKRGKVQHIRGSPKKRKISGKAFFSSESIPGKILADVKNQITDKASELKRADQKKLFLANFILPLKIVKNIEQESFSFYFITL